MRIVVSGTHASGKSTLVDGFSSGHPEYRVLADPYDDLLDEFDEPDARLFGAQLEIAARRLIAFSAGDNVIAERGPLDFLAYLAALDRLGRPGRSGGLLRAGMTRTEDAAAHVDLLVLVPLSARTPIHVSDDEDPEPRNDMNEALLELAEDPDLTGGRVIEVSGPPAARLAQLADAVEALQGSGRA